MQRNVRNKHNFQPKKVDIVSDSHINSSSSTITYLSFNMIFELRAMFCRNNESVSFKRLQYFKFVGRSWEWIILLMFML